jgi:uncharacterized protein YegJ (DUF2314 family)
VPKKGRQKEVFAWRIEGEDSCAVSFAVRRSLLQAATVALAFLACSRGEVRVPAPPPNEAGQAGDARPADDRHAFARPRDAVAEFGVLTERPQDVLLKLTAREGLAALLEPRHCGSPASCDAVRALIRDGVGVEVRIVAAEDWGIPAEALLPVVAKALTAAERVTVHKRPTVVVVRVGGPFSPKQLVARAGFALTASIAGRLEGLVYDETLRRIETASQFAEHAIVAPIGDPAFREDRIVIQFYQEEDGTARLISLGMRRFGAPDLEVRGAQVGAGRSLGNAMNAVAYRLAAGETLAPLMVTLDDVVRATGKSSAELHPGKAGPATELVDLVVPPHQEGDPDNAIVRLVPPGGATPSGYDDLVRGLFGVAEQLVDQNDDAALIAASERAARSFPAAVSRWKAMGSPRSTLLVKLPFAIPNDGGLEWMWVNVMSVQDTTISGSLANSPAYITDLKGGAPVRGKRKDLSDWLIKLPDGGTEGGETIRVLEGRK